MVSSYSISYHSIVCHSCNYAALARLAPGLDVGHPPRTAARSQLARLVCGVRLREGTGAQDSLDCTLP